MNGLKQFVAEIVSNAGFGAEIFRFQCSGKVLHKKWWNTLAGMHSP